MNRLLGFSIVSIWLIAFTALLVRDVVPYWRAQEPPRGALPVGDSQVGIFDARGHRLGSCWASVRDQTDLTTFATCTELDGLAPLEGGPLFGHLLIDSVLMFSRPQRELIDFEIELRREEDLVVELIGHRIGQDFACTLRLGRSSRDFSFDARTTAELGELLRPFAHLPNLHVGQTWQLRVVDCMSLMRGRGVSLAPQLARVTAVETIRCRERDVRCYRIETDGVTAWAEESGRVLLQRVAVPLLGTLEVRDEPFDAAARQRARRFVRAVAAKRRPAARGS